MPRRKPIELPAGHRLGPYASFVGGVWRSHESSPGAWAAVIGSGSLESVAVRVEGARGVLLPERQRPRKREVPRVGGPGGQHGPRVTVDLVTTARREAYDAAAKRQRISLSELVRRAGDQYIELQPHRKPTG